jgi:hypothetical protein
MIISNELVGVDITLNYSSRFGYNAMGFDTSTVTQDCDDMDGYFLELQLIVPYLYFNIAILFLGKNTVTWFYILI